MSHPTRTHALSSFARRALVLAAAAAVAAPMLTACSTEGPTAPPAVPVNGANQTGFVVAWGVTNGDGGNTSGGTGTAGTGGGRPGASDSTVRVEVRAPIRRR